MRRTEALSATSRTHLLALVVGTGVVLSAWAGVVFSPGHLLQVDFAFPLTPDRILDDFRAAWKPSSGSNVIASTRLVAGGFPALMTHVLGLDSSVTVKTIVAVHLLIAMGGMYAMVYWTLPAVRSSRVVVSTAALVGGLYVVLNVWAVAHVHQVFLFTQYAATPLILGLWILALRRRRATYALLTAFVYAAIGATNPHFAVFNAVALVVASVVVGAGTMAWSRFFRLVCAFTIAAVLLAAFFVFPIVGRLFYGGELTPEFDRTVPGVETLAVEQTPGNTLGLTGSAFFSTRARPSGPGAFSWQPLAVVPFVLVVAAAVRQSPARRIGVFMLVLVLLAVGLQLASWWHITRDLFAVVVQTWPLGWVLREPERLGGMVAVAYGWALAYWVAVLLGWDRSTRSIGRVSARVRVPVAAMLIAAIAWPSVGFDSQMMWGREEFSWRPIEVPAEFHETGAWVADVLPEDAWLLAVSPGLRDPLWDLTRTVAPFETFSVQARYRVVDPRAAPPVIDAFLNDPSAANARGLLQLGMSHVLLVHDYTDGIQLQQRMDKSRVLIWERGGKWLTLYSIVGDPSPLLSLTTLGVSSDVGGRWSRSSPTEYRVLIPSSNSARQLTLREPYDAGWVLRAGDMSVQPVPPGRAQLTREAQLVFELPPGEELDATISFAGTIWYVAGIVVSSMTVLVMVGMCVVSWCRGASVGRGPSGR